MAPKYGDWGKWSKKQDGSWEWGEPHSHQWPQEEKQKNWRCPVCAFTGNAHWWKTCGRASCGATWAPKHEDEDAPGRTDPSETAKLALAREELALLSKLLPEGHTTVREYACKVSALEDAQKNSVSPAERLRRLLQAKKTLEEKQVAAHTARDKAKEALATAATSLRSRMEECDTIVREIAANALDVAELTRSVAPEATANAAPTIDMCQDLRAQIEILQPSDLDEAGLNMAGMGEFFGMFRKVLLLLERANHRSAAPEEPPAVAPAVVPALATPLVSPPSTPLRPPAESSQITADPPVPPPRPAAVDEATAIDVDTDGAAEALEKADKILAEARKDDINEPIDDGSLG